MENVAFCISFFSAHVFQPDMQVISAIGSALSFVHGQGAACTTDNYIAMP